MTRPATDLTQALVAWPLDREQKNFLTGAVADIDDGQARELLGVLREAEQSVIRCADLLESEAKSKRLSLQAGAPKTIAGKSRLNTEKLLPPRKDRDELVGIIKSGATITKVESELQALIAKYEAHADVTGDDSFVIRSATNLGNSIIGNGPPEELARRGEIAVNLARKALARSTTDAYVWALLADGYEAQGSYDTAESISWYSVHRFPEDPLRWTKLATLLELRERREDAERLFRQALERFPANDVVATQLAALLASKGEDKAIAEAQRLLARVLARSPDDEVARGELWRISRNSGPAKKNLAHKRHLTSPVEFAVGAADLAMRAVLDAGRMRQLAFELPVKKDSAEWRSVALAEIEQFLQSSENMEFAQYLKAELLGREDLGLSRSNNSFALAFVDAIRRKDKNRLMVLGSEDPEHAQLSEVACAFFGDRASANKSLEWLRHPVPPSPRSAAVLHSLLVAKFGVKIGIKENVDIFEFKIRDTDDFLARFESANSNVREALIDAALAPSALSLAEAA